MDSGSSTAGSYLASCASDEEELAFLKRVRYLRGIRLALAVTISSFAISVISCEAVPLLHYKRSSPFEQIGLFLWPQNFDLRPTIALLSCGCVIALQSILYIITTILPSPRSHIRLLNVVAAIVAISGFIAALVSVIFVIYLPGSSYPKGFTENETLHSWTCKWKTIRGTPSTNPNNAPATPPAHFARDCRTARAGFILMALLIGLEVVMGIVVCVGVWFERNVSKQRGKDKSQLGKVKIIPKYPGT